MKKTVLFLFLLLVMIGCKDKEETPTGDSKTPSGNTAKLDAGDEQECLGLAKYKKLSEDSEKADWLKNYGKAVCIDTLYKSVIETHQIINTGFNVTSNKTFKIKGEDLKKLIDKYSAYEKYVSFKIDPTSKEIIDIDIVSDFSHATASYSLPLFRSILRKNAGYDITFEFMRATISSSTNETIIFKVLDGADPAVYFDFSDEPRAIPDYIRIPL